MTKITKKELINLIKSGELSQSFRRLFKAWLVKRQPKETEFLNNSVNQPILQEDIPAPQKLTFAEKLDELDMVIKDVNCIYGKNNNNCLLALIVKHQSPNYLYFGGDNMKVSLDNEEYALSKLSELNRFYDSLIPMETPAVTMEEFLKQHEFEYSCDFYSSAFGDEPIKVSEYIHAKNKNFRIHIAKDKSKVAIFIAELDTPVYQFDYNDRTGISAKILELTQKA